MVQMDSHESLNQPGYDGYLWTSNKLTILSSRIMECQLYRQITPLISLRLAVNKLFLETAGYVYCH